MISSDEKALSFTVIKGKCIDTVDILEEVRPLISVEGKNDLAVALGKEFIRVGIPFTYFLMVVDLSVHCER
jgi:hypothetical protein